MKRVLISAAACLVAIWSSAASAATVNANIPSPLTRAVIELGTSEVFPSGVGNWGLDNQITVSGTQLDFITFEELPPQSFGGPPGGSPFPGVPTSLTVGNTTFRATRLDPAIPFTLPVFGFDPGAAFDTAFTDGPLLLADANTRLIMDFITPVDILQFGLSFASGTELREGLVGSVEFFSSDISLGRFDLRADLIPGDGLTSARVTAAVPLPASALMLLSALGLGLVFRRRRGAAA